MKFKFCSSEKPIVIFFVILFFLEYFLIFPGVIKAAFGDVDSNPGSWADTMYHNFGDPSGGGGGVTVTRNADGTVTVGGHTFDAKAVAKAVARAILSGAFDVDDPANAGFVEALKAFAMMEGQNAYSSTIPQFMEWLAEVDPNVIAYATAATPERISTETQSAFQNALQDAYEAVAQESASSNSTAASRYLSYVADGNTDGQTQMIRDWQASHPGASNAELMSYLSSLGLDCSNGETCYDSPGQVNEVADNAIKGYVVGLGSSSACTDAFGANSWLNDSSNPNGNNPSGGNPSPSTPSNSSTPSSSSNPNSNNTGNTGSNSGTNNSDSNNSNNSNSDNNNFDDSECDSDSDCGGCKRCSSGNCVAVTVPSLTISNATNSTQITSAPTLAATTNRGAACQFKKDSSFTYGSGTTFDVTGGSNHTYKLNSLVNGDYSYYIVCKDNDSCGTTATATITFTVDLSQDPDNAPIVENDTDSVITSATSTLAVTTNTNSSCEYNESGGFNFGSGTAFSTTGNYNHNTTIGGLTAGDHIYYVVCRDVATRAVSDALGISFRVDFSQDPDNAPVIANITPVTQTGSLPVLAVTTNLVATCQYKNASFTYGSGSQLNTSDGYSHNISISSLADGAYTFYVICKSNDTNVASGAKTILTTLDRPDTNSDAPDITNNTNGHQTVSDPTLSVKTDIAAACQYKNSSFSYGSGTAFSTTGGTTHSVKLSNIDDGQHTYYVACKGSANGVANENPFEVVFTVDVDNEADDCADLDSNDLENDNDRSDSGSGSDDTSYLWQSVEEGKREKFDQVDWFAGYQFSLDKDGVATELCGYFTEDETNKIALFNGSYKELAKAEVTGTGSWECADIDPVELSEGARYYVIAEIDNQSIYYEYKSGLLPADSGNAVIEAGVRQTDGNIVKYDYMIFGLVDVKVNYESEVTEGPEITSTSPSGTMDDSSVYISVETDDDAECRFDRDDIDYEDMDYALQEVSSGNYSQLVCNLDDGKFTFYVRCKDEDGEVNDASAKINFTVDD